jgi:hypothetical protein
MADHLDIDMPQIEEGDTIRYAVEKQEKKGAAKEEEKVED